MMKINNFSLITMYEYFLFEKSDQILEFISMTT